jgi:transcriptional regulator with PAS, ATPase and Fis domain
LNAALNNLQTHITTAYQTFEKFDRIAQREFAKDAVSIAQIDLDIELLLHIQPHPRLNTSTIDTVQKQQQQFKGDLLQQYDSLVTATLEQKNKVVHLNQQTANVSVSRTTCEMIEDRVTNITEDVRLYIQAMEKEVKHEVPTLDTIKSLYLQESKIQKAEQLILNEKQASVAGFVHCMQAISQVEQSISLIYPRLAELESSIKALRVDIENGRGAVAKKRIKLKPFLK